MQAATAALIPLLRKLGELVVAEFTLAERVKKRVESLLTELDMMYAVLHKVGDVPAEQLDPQVLIWAGKVRELSYNMEDAVDAYMVRVYDGSHGDFGPNNMKNKVKKFFKRTKKLFGKGKVLHQISNTINDIQELAEDLDKFHRRYTREGFADIMGNSIDPRLKAVYKDITELVGIEGTRDELIKNLFDGDEMSKPRFKTMSIVGFGGLGKTTLAKAVYDKIREKFSCGVFVSVSRKPDITQIFKKMLYGLDSTKFVNINEAIRDNGQIIDELRAFLQDKRYLIVIDDIWDEQAWEIINCVFSQSHLGSRVIITTRINSVSRACCPSGVDIIHKMESLNNDDSKRLFNKRIFPQGSECPSELEQVSREILKKCGGVPLAIITISSILANNDQHIQQKYQWDNILSSIGRGLAEGGTAKDMERILSFSYYDLPSHLKSCLLYLSIFPEDYEINRDRLIWRWIAEGFIQDGEQEIRLFELGERNFSELINKNLIRPAYVDDEGRVRSCRVHDMVLDLICSLSRKENFVTILDGTKQCRNNSDSMVRILSLQNSNSGLNTHRLDATSMLKLRSVTLFRTDVDLIKTLSSFQLLRVLDLEDCNIGESSNQIYLRYVENLLQLKYLGLRNTHVGVLPMEIGKLQFLQTLDLTTRVVVEVPSSVVQLKRLMCLYVDNDMRLPVGIGKLVFLEELGCVKVGGTDAIEKELGKLTELRVLGLCWKGDDKSVCDLLLMSLTNLQKLHTLDIYTDGDARFNVSWARWVPPPHLHTFRFRGCTSTLPKWIKHSFFPVLCCLYIYVDRVRLDVDIQMLGKLCALRFLWLETTTAHCTLVEKCIIGDDAFPCLRQCRFYNFQTWPSMFLQGSMPRLESLRFYAQASHIAGGHLNMDMEHLLSLQEVKVYLWIGRRVGKNCSPAVNKATDMLKHALDAHPNRPTLSLHQIPLTEEVVEEEEPSEAITVSDREGEAVVL